MSKGVKKLPIINVRDLCVFPKVKIPLFIGRQFTIDAVLESKKNHNGKIFVFSQKSGDTTKPFKINQIHKIGTECKIIESVLYPDNSMKMLLESVSVYELVGLFNQDDIRYAECIKINDTQDTKIGKVQRQEILDLLIRWKPNLAYDTNFDITESLIGVRSDKAFLNKVLRVFCVPEQNKVAKGSKKELNSQILKQRIQTRQNILGETNSKKRIDLLVNSMKKECIADINFAM